MAAQSLFARLVLALALLGLCVTPVARPVAFSVASAANDGGLMAGMPCCPDEAPVEQDCTKSCPLMALCATQVLQAPAGVTSLLRILPLARALPLDQRPLAGLDTLPGRKPPKSRA